MITDRISGDRPTHAAPTEDKIREEIREQERARIARDLHDELGAHLTGIKMALGLLRESLAQPGADAGAAQRGHAEYADRLVDEAADAMHGIIDNLCPPIVEFGLAEALEWQSRRFTRQTGIVCRQRCAAEAAGLDEFAVISLFRIVREALNNVAKYAQADNVEICVEHQGDTLHLRIADDGRGFDPAALDHGAGPSPSAGGNGLGNMRRRARALAGSLLLTSGIGRGTAIEVAVPVAH